MPKKVKKTKISNVKAEASAVKQVVNVRVGDQVTKRKTVRRYSVRRGGGGGGGGGGGMGGLGVFNRPLPVMTQALGAPPAPVNEYNELLRALAEERRQRMSTQTLGPNTAPLTTNGQRNQLLSISVPQTPLTPIVEAFAIAQDKVVDKQLYDDPLTNENMFVNSSRLGENIAQKLPVSNFDEGDLDTYDDENQDEQSSLANEVASRLKSRKAYDAKKREYENYIQYLRTQNERYGLSIKPKPLRDLQSQSQIREEMRRIDDLILAKPR